MEKAILFMRNLNISQKANGSFSHKNDLAIDIIGRDDGIEDLKAPFTGTIKKIYANDNAVWLESNEKVIYADGTIDYMTVLTIHDNDISNLKIGDIIKQGEIYYQEGSKGNATGNHIHLAVGKGKFTGSGWYKCNDVGFCINNQYDVYKALFLNNDTNIINDGGYNWKKINDIEENFYIVKQGDNLTKIANKFNTTIDDLVRLNNIKNKNLIFVDQKLKIPTNKDIYFNKYKGNTNSIVDALKSLGYNSSYKYRSEIAKKNNINNYTGTLNQNIEMLKLLKQGKLKK